MFGVVFQILLLAGYVSALVLLVLARRWEEQAESFTRIAAIIALVAAVLYLAVNLILVTAPDLVENSLSYYLLVFMAAVDPVATLVGAVLTLMKRQSGPFVLMLGIGAWLAYSVLGVVTTAAGWLH